MKSAIALFACTSVTAAALAAEPAPIPIENFFKVPAISGASISPDGRTVALRQRLPQGRSALTAVDTTTRAQNVVVSFSNADVNSFFWNSDQRLTFTRTNIDFQGETRTPAISGVDRNGQNLNFYTRISTLSPSFADATFSADTYLASINANGFPYRKGQGVLLLTNTDDSDTPRMYGNYGASTDDALLNTPRHTFEWLLDVKGDIRVATARREGKNVVFVREEREWREIAAFAPDAAEAFKPMLYVDRALYVKARNGRNESAIYRYDLQANRVEDKPIISVPGFDADGYFVLDDEKMLGFRVNTDIEVTVWFDDAMKAVQEEVDALLPKTINTISVGSHSKTPFVLVDVHSDVQDSIYMLYNRETKTLLRLGGPGMEHDAERMSPMKMVYYKARDGMSIPAYVTLPKAAKTRPLPMVVLMGDTQWRRNAAWSWNAEVQFLASRGYIVLQPEPRGTRGFGYSHEAAGYKQWGQAIQDDIADSVKWAISQGLADPARVCIAGAGYGGYAAMMGLIRDPGLFKCGISWSGITDITRMFDRDWKGTADYRNLPRLRTTIGSPEQDAEQFKATSPQHNAARITQPVLLAYGKQDFRVPFSEGRKFYQTLSASNSKVEWLQYEASPEDWVTQGNRIDLWKHIEVFLAKHIGAATPGS